MSKNEKAVSDEQIIAALLTAGSVREAADSLKISPGTIYERRRDKEFQAAYSEAKGDLVRGAVTAINNSLTDSVKTIAAIMNDQSVNPATRLQAAQTIINSADKLTARLENFEGMADSRRRSAENRKKGISELLEDFFDD